MTADPDAPFDVAAERAADAVAAAHDEREEVARVFDVDLGVPTRAYVPDPSRGTIVFAHGGGFVFGDLDTHDAHMRRLANRTGWAVLAVDYRRSPEHVHPAAVEDMDHALAGLRSDGTALGLPDSPLAVIGDSAGAKLALGLALRHPDTFRAVVLVYPFVDPRLRFVAADHPDTGTVVNARWYWDRYLGGHDPSDPEVSPIDSPDLGSLPRTLVVTAGRDYLRPENDELVRRIRAAGGDVTVDHHPDVGHGFWRRPDEHPESEASLAAIAGFLRGPESDSRGG